MASETETIDGIFRVNTVCTDQTPNWIDITPAFGHPAWTDGRSCHVYMSDANGFVTGAYCRGRVPVSKHVFDSDRSSYRSMHTAGRARFSVKNALATRRSLGDGQFEYHLADGSDIRVYRAGKGTYLMSAGLAYGAPVFLRRVDRGHGVRRHKLETALSQLAGFCVLVKALAQCFSAATYAKSRAMKADNQRAERIGQLQGRIDRFVDPRPAWRDEIADLGGTA